MAQFTKIEVPDTAPGIIHKFSVAGTEGYINVTLDSGGMPIALFITMAKEGSTIGGFVDAFARLVSISLQAGVPLELLCKKMRYLRFEPSGMTTNRQIPEATSIVDYVFHWMEDMFTLQANAA